MHDRRCWRWRRLARRRRDGALDVRFLDLARRHLHAVSGAGSRARQWRRPDPPRRPRPRLPLAPITPPAPPPTSAGRRGPAPAAGGAALPVELLRRDLRQMLVLEDHGGEPLERLLGVPLDVAAFLRIATPLTAALGHVHARGLIHKDVRPANILVDTASGGVWLTGFGIASRLPREHQAPAPPEVIAGTLAYMAPEQTGRMNRSVDSRSDLYALGVTLYEMLTGQLPFAAVDPMEWVHCHIARQPVPPYERVAGVPGALSAIVMKLLAKTEPPRVCRRLQLL